MSSNRPFFSNFLAAFRAHSALRKATTSSVTSTSTNSSSQSTHLAAAATALTSPITARAITTKATSNPQSNTTTTTITQANSHFTPRTRRPSHSPVSRSPASPTSFGSKQRRGSDSSSDGGFRDALGGEKWYIGGRTAAGEERFYRLGMVRRERSGDRLSLDRLSL